MKKLMMMKQKDTIPADQQESYILDTYLPLSIYADRASASRPARQQPNLFSSHLAKTHQRFTSNLRPISPSHVKGKSPIRPAPADVRKARSKNIPAASTSASEPTAAVLFTVPLSGSRRARGARMRHTARGCALFRFDPGDCWSAHGVGRMGRFWLLGV